MRRCEFLIVMILGVATLAACGSGPPVKYDYSREPDPRAKAYVVGAGDVLRVDVWREADLSRQVRVRPDGFITLPLIGDIKVAGRTTTDVKGEVSRQLAKFIQERSLDVAVGVSDIGSYAFFITGNVEKPGRYVAQDYLTILEGLTLAGGPNRFADSRAIVILRRDRTGTRKIPIDYDTLSTGERLEQNIVILPGDNILVP
jgi:polysaccharide export outer membrane protein